MEEHELRLRCGNDLGAVYALLSISEKWLQILPLAWWMGLSPRRMDTASVPAGTAWQSPAYTVRYRCWFINDEVLLTGWHIEEGKRAILWRRVFETVLRCGGQYGDSRHRPRL